MAYPYPENLPITAENLIKFIRNFFEGRLTPYKYNIFDEHMLSSPLGFQTLKR